jgi:hypothetical protein
MKRITKKAWFGKKTFGWGIRPVSLEGWLVTIVLIFAMIIEMNSNHKTTTGYAILAVILIIY